MGEFAYPRDAGGRPWREFPEDERLKLAYEEMARNGGTGYPNYYRLIVLNEYQIANLRALLYAVESGEIEGWNTGDWVGEIPWRLPAPNTMPHGGPNKTPRPAREVHRERFPQYFQEA